LNKKKDLVIGLGEIGLPILKILSKEFPTVGFDARTNLMDKKKFERLKNFETEIAHICIPFNENFIKSVIKLKKKFKPSIIVIHSTVSPYTTEKLQKKLSTPIVYSATRGVHKRMLRDLKRYTKFYSIYKWAPKSNWTSKTFEKRMKQIGVKTKKMSNPLTLELAKIVVDTSYYGWLINYAQISNMIAIKHKVNYDEMWSFADEIHKFLGNRPKMYPGFIGGHCVIPNLDLMKDKKLDQINAINDIYLKKVKNTKSISKKLAKGKQSYDKK
jgi:UDP-N-acetyl-D-mannosaminuronate dehydrogenase